MAAERLCGRSPSMTRRGRSQVARAEIENHQKPRAADDRLVRCDAAAVVERHILPNLRLDQDLRHTQGAGFVTAMKLDGGDLPHVDRAAQQHGAADIQARQPLVERETDGNVLRWRLENGRIGEKEEGGRKERDEDDDGQPEQEILIPLLHHMTSPAGPWPVVATGMKSAASRREF